MVEASVLVGPFYWTDIVGSSTTQITEVSRRASRQISHSSASVRLKQRLHGLIFSLTSCSASASPMASSFLPLMTWKAMRWALLGPMEVAWRALL